MISLRKRKYGVVLTVAALIICAICARIAARYGYYAQPLSTVRTVIYMGLLAAWAFSSRRASSRPRCAGICWPSRD